MSDGPTLVEFPQTTNLRDVAACMRSVADAIEAGQWGDVKMIAAVLVRDNLSMAVFGWGDCTPLEAVGAFARGTMLDDNVGLNPAPENSHP